MYVFAWKLFDGLDQNEQEEENPEEGGNAATYARAIVSAAIDRWRIGDRVHVHVSDPSLDILHDLDLLTYNNHLSNKLS